MNRVAWEQRQAEKKQSALHRQESARTPSEQLKHLDALFGVGKGAVKERAKLQKKLG